ncbi:TetR-like C-terminal domain-containing protein [Rhodococcus sp. 27YEA6]|uniref:TetR-like C-terminal domain-containing protein n=1 Tax=Rhodococcus sp. 27YEA6 TaxID=3156273 RepID=UPI00384B3A22
MLGSVFHGYASLELGGSFSHSAPDSAESWSRILEALDSMLTNWPVPQNRVSVEANTSVS